MKKIKARIGDLIIDNRLTELRPINQIFVSRYRQAYRTGASLPPILIDEQTSRVISGNHRLTAMLQEYGPDKTVVVNAEKFTDELSVLKMVVKENIAHGNPLDGISRKRIALAMIDLGAKEEEVASAFNVTVNRLEKWGENLITVLGKNGTMKYAPTKRGLDKQGPITEAEYADHKKKDRGIPAGELIEQLLRWFKNGWVEPTEGVVEVCVELRKELDKFFKEVVKAA